MDVKVVWLCHLLPLAAFSSLWVPQAVRSIEEEFSPRHRNEPASSAHLLPLSIYNVVLIPSHNKINHTCLLK